MTWRKDVPCSGQTALFFNHDLETQRERVIREAAAKRICAGCPVQTNCLEWAVKHEESGIWGGTTERERERLTRRSVPPYVRRAEPAVASGAPEPSWREMECRGSLTGIPVRLMIAESGVSWHGFQWAVYRGETLAFLADNEPDAWLYFHSLVMA